MLVLFDLNTQKKQIVKIYLFIYFIFLLSTHKKFLLVFIANINQQTSQQDDNKLLIRDSKCWHSQVSSGEEMPHSWC